MGYVEYLANNSTTGTLKLHRRFDSDAIGEMRGSIIGKLYLLCIYRYQSRIMEFRHSGKAYKLRACSAHHLPSTGSSPAIQHNSDVRGNESTMRPIVNSQRGSNALMGMEHRIVLCVIRVAFSYSA